jgi:hypothetical protein
MGYNDLSDSGMTDAARRDEATRIVKMIKGSVDVSELALREIHFVNEIENPWRPVSTKQLFYLRDIKDRHL